MRHGIAVLAAVCILLLTVGCNRHAAVKTTVTGSVKTYCELEDGNWMCDGIVYQHRLEIHGRLPNATADSVYVYLSNTPDISFEQAWKADGLSSNTADYFDVNEAVLVDRH